MNNLVKDLSFKVIFKCLKLVESFQKKISVKNIWLEDQLILMKFFENFDFKRRWHYLVKKYLFPIDSLVVWCPTWSKNLGQTLCSRSLTNAKIPHWVPTRGWLLTFSLQNKKKSTITLKSELNSSQLRTNEYWLIICIV